MIDNKHADIYGAMNLLDAAIQSHQADAVIEGIEAWLAEDDQDRPAFREMLGQGVQDAIAHATTIDEGKNTITIVTDRDSLLRFEWIDNDDEPASGTFKQTVLNAVKKALAWGDWG